MIAKNPNPKKEVDVKKSLLIAALMCPLTFAQTTQTEIDQSQKKIQNLKFDIGVSALSDLRGGDNNNNRKATGKGFNIGFGKIFDLNESLTTTTSLVGQYSSLDLEESQVDYRTYDIGVTQTLRLRMPVNNMLFQPFVEAGVYRGNLNTNALIISSRGSGSGIDIIGAEVDQSFTRLSAGLGLRVQYHGISPFIKYNYSRLLLDSDAEVELTLNGRNATSDAVEFQSSSADLNAQAITLGMGFDF